MKHHLQWWAIVLRGILAIAFGVVAFARPGLTILGLVVFFGAYAIVDGLIALGTMFWAVEHRLRWWPFALEGLAGIVFGVLTFIQPAITALVLLVLIAWWAVITGVLELVAAIQLWRAVPGEWLLALSGLLSIIFGVVLFAVPAAGAVWMVWVIGAYALMFGIMMVMLGARLHMHKPAPEPDRQPHADELPANLDH